MTKKSGAWNWPMNIPSIRPAAELHGKTLMFRNAHPDDAEFILSLRTDPEKSRYLSAVSPDVQRQRDWLAAYRDGTGQAYFIIHHEGAAIGTIRLYDAQGDSFCWGSWILADHRPKQAAVESFLMVFSYAIDHLGFRESHFDVREGNTRARAFYERMGAEQTGSAGDDIYLRMSAEAISAARLALRDFLPSAVKVFDIPRDRRAS
jgi:RimJ/RimL family protein N-acetyltransferase